MSSPDISGEHAALSPGSLDVDIITDPNLAALLSLSAKELRDRIPTRTLLAPIKSRPQAAPLMLQDPSPDAPVQFGKYELIRRIGAGGMGEVFLAREGQSVGGQAPRACVVKKVLPSLLENRAFVGRFLDESRVVVRLKHNNIARVYAMGEVNGEYFLTMEYVQGKTVSRFTRRLRDRKQQLPLGLILLLGERVCTGLQYAHDAKDEKGDSLHLVHRDLSPANVCISYRGEVKIIDFGAAQSTLKEEQTAPRVVIGNLTYMAPEQAKKQLVDRRADVYSVGVMLWELLAWHALPQKGDPIERWRKAANPSWEPPSLYHGTLPREVDDLVLKALKKNPNDRYATAEIFGEAMKKVRLRHAPDTSEKDLADLLTRVFKREKENEDQVLAHTMQGKAISDEPTDKTKRMQFVPPTALAFEHTSVVAPAGYVPSHDEEVTDPGRPGNIAATRIGPPPQQPQATLDDGMTPMPGKDPRTALRLADPVAATRTSFGVTYNSSVEPRLENSLIQEIEPVSGEELNEEYLTRPYGPFEGRFMWLAAGVFVGAIGLGFLGILLWAQFH
jgi:eukaryotic-like serine/threonine-protein kinase